MTHDAERRAREVDNLRAVYQSLQRDVAPRDGRAGRNLAAGAVGGGVLFSGGWWILSARTWFIGPRVQGTPEELAAIERELEAVGAPEIATTPPA